MTLNSSTYVGSRPDNTNRTRFFHNLYGIFQVTEKLGLIADFDYGVDQRQTGSSTYNDWTSWAAIVKYQLSPKVGVAGRIENYTDKKGLVDPPLPPMVFKPPAILSILITRPFPMPYGVLRLAV